MSDDSQLSDGLLENQFGLPSFEHKSGNWRSVAFIANLYGVSEQSIRDWINDQIIERPVNGLLDTLQVIKKVYRHQRKILEGTNNQNLTSERVKLTQIQREIADMDLRRKKGELLSADEVRKAAFDAGRRVRDAIENVPSRVSALIAAETDTTEVKHILTKELRRALEDCASSPFEGDQESVTGEDSQLDEQDQSIEESNA